MGDSVVNQETYQFFSEALGAEDMQAVLGEYLLSVPNTISQLLGAYDNGDFSMVAMYAHSLKSNASQIGADGMFESAVRLESLAKTLDSVAVLEAITALSASWESVQHFLRSELH